MLWSVDSLPGLVPHEPADNAGEATGFLLPTRVDRGGHTMAWQASTDRAQPQHVGFVLAYGLGQVSTSGPVDSLYTHTITPRDALELVPFTLAVRKGGPSGGTINERFASACVNSFTISLSGSYLQVSADVIGTGYRDTDLVEEVVSALDNATSLTLAANSVYGASAQDRLDSVHQVQSSFNDANDYYSTPVNVTAVSSATPAVLTIDSLGGAGSNTNYRILYRKGGVSWVSFPARVDTSPFRVGQVVMKVNGDWDGSNYNRGFTLGCDVRSISLTWNNNAAPRFCMSGAGDYADMIQAGDAELTLSMERELWDWWFQQVGYNSPRSTSLYLKIVSQETVGSSSNPSLEIILPKIGIIGEPIEAADGRLVTRLDIRGLSHATYPGIVAILKDAFTSYAG